MILEYYEEKPENCVGVSLGIIAVVLVWFKTSVVCLPTYNSWIYVVPPS
jgi:hypothetical protein